MANILLVDDSLDMADAFAEVLRSEGHAVSLARNGREGIARVIEARPDLIISDVEMPSMNGLDMVREIASLGEGYDRIPVLLASGVVDLHLLAERAKTPYYLCKPFTIEQLRVQLSRALAPR